MPHSHINADGLFQSDKYATCPPGKVPLSTKDPMAQDLLWEYAQRRRPVDRHFSDDLETALKTTGFQPPAAPPDIVVHLSEDKTEVRGWVPPGVVTNIKSVMRYVPASRVEAVQTVVQRLLLIEDDYNKIKLAVCSAVPIHGSEFTSATVQRLIDTLARRTASLRTAIGLAQKILLDGLDATTPKATPQEISTPKAETPQLTPSQLTPPAHRKRWPHCGGEVCSRTTFMSSTADGSKRPHCDCACTLCGG